MKKCYLLLPIVAFFALSACGNGASSESSEPASPIEADIRLNSPQKEFNKTNTEKSASAYVNSVNSLSKDFYKNAFKGDNLVYSPVSISTCYSMLYEGARNNSREELKNFLHYDDSFDHNAEIKNMLLRNAINDEEKKTYLDIAQSFWVDNSFADRIYDEYVDILTNQYYAEAFQGSLKSDEMHKALADYINEKTRDFLHMTADDFKEYAGVLWLLNTIYMKSSWTYSFDEKFNHTAKFTSLNNSKKDATFMINQYDSYYLEREDYAIASLPFTHGMNFNILLPKSGRDYGSILADETAIEDLHNFSLSKERTVKEIYFDIPQFKFQQSYDLTAILPNMGVKDIFDRYKADLSGIGYSRAGLFVSRSKHEAGIEVTNDGAEAAAYTIIEVSEKAVSPEPKEIIRFVVDHSFAYSITNRDGLTLFAGTVAAL